MSLWRALKLRRRHQRGIGRASFGSSSAGFTLVETMVATGVVLTAIGAVFLASGQAMRINKSSHDVAVASSALHERMQQLQATDWETLTDSESYKDQVWTDPVTGTTENADGLLKYSTQAGVEVRRQGAMEYVTVSAFRPVPSASPTPAPITATRAATGAIVTSATTNLVDEKMVRVDMRLAWTDDRMNAPRSVAVTGLMSRK